MDLMSRVQGFMARELERQSTELAEKYGVPQEEVSGVVESFLNDTYRAALEQAEAISRMERPVLLFIGRKDCAICRRSLPGMEEFLRGRPDLELVRLDYTEAPGLLYHMIVQQEKGMLPLIAMILKGCIRMLFAGECIGAEVYEKYYGDLQSGLSQNVYAL